MARKSLGGSGLDGRGMPLFKGLEWDLRTVV